MLRALCLASLLLPGVASAGGLRDAFEIGNERGIWAAALVGNVPTAEGPVELRLILRALFSLNENAGEIELRRNGEVVCSRGITSLTKTVDDVAWFDIEKPEPFDPACPLDHDWNKGERNGRHQLGFRSLQGSPDVYESGMIIAGEPLLFRLAYDTALTKAIFTQLHKPCGAANWRGRVLSFPDLFLCDEERAVAVLTEGRPVLMAYDRAEVIGDSFVVHALRPRMFALWIAERIRDGEVSTDRWNRVLQEEPWDITCTLPRFEDDIELVGDGGTMWVHAKLVKYEKGKVQLECQLE